MNAVTAISLDAHVGRGGPAAGSFARLWASLWDQDYVAPELLELCRLTFARLHADATEIGTDNPYAKAGDLQRRAAVLAGAAFEDPAFSAADRAILLFAEYYWIDTQSITDEAADAVKQHVGEAGLVFLIEALGCIDGRMRAARCLRDLAPVYRGETAHG